jgi:hypothetical protein
LNPELQRNAWLELGPHRRIAGPAVLLLVFALFGAGGEAGDWRARLVGPAYVLSFVILYLYGAHQAAESVAEEVRDRTWDLQRLSALGPGAMTVGKLFGAPMFAWYLGIPCLVVLAFASSAVPNAPNPGWLVVTYAAGAIAVHGASIGLALQEARREARAGRRLGVLVMLLPLLLAMWVLPLADRGAAQGLAWHGRYFDGLTFLALSACAFAAWAAFGAYRGFCRELQVRTLPWAWPGFALFLAFWLAGFASEGGGFARAFTGFGLLAALGATYLALYSEPTTAMEIRRVSAAFARGDAVRAMEEMPLWPTTLVLAFAFALAAPLAWQGFGESLGLDGWRELTDYVARAPLALVLAALRDGAILVFFASAARPRRVVTTALLYAALLWWVIPGLLAAVGLAFAAGVVNPFFGGGGTRAAILLGIQAAIAVALAASRWRRHHGPKG